MSYEILTSLLSNPTLETWMFYILSALAICLGIGVLHDRVIIRSGFILIGVFGAIAGIFLLLSAQFIAMAQIMIYAVAITLVVVIALMLTNPRHEIERLDEDLDESLPPVAKFFSSCKRNASLWVAVLSFLTIYVAISGESRWPLATVPMADDAVKVLGEALTTTYAIPFEFSSVLLLAALMGAIMLAKAEPKATAEDTVEGEALLQESPKQDDTLALTR
jgi:NADH:ubiquinone oxidoreductase subunit 6 (subunit J)